MTPARSAAIIRQARELLREGKIVAVKGLGGFLLACDAENDARRAAAAQLASAAATSLSH